MPGGELMQSENSSTLSRLDAWGRWVLLVTVEAQLVTQELSTQLINYLRGVQDDASEPAASIIEFLNQPGTNGDEGVSATRLIHGVSASLISRSASQANLSAFPRGTILVPWFWWAANGSSCLRVRTSENAAASTFTSVAAIEGPRTNYGSECFSGTHSSRWSKCQV